MENLPFHQRRRVALLGTPARTPQSRRRPGLGWSRWDTMRRRAREKAVASVLAGKVRHWNLQVCRGVQESCMERGVPGAISVRTEDITDDNTQAKEPERAVLALGERDRTVGTPGCWGTCPMRIVIGFVGLV